MHQLKYWKVSESVIDPVFATSGSACFDIRAWITGESSTLTASGQWPGDLSTYIHPNETRLIPTGLVFDIPGGFSVRLHPRSGLSINQGITLANCEGVIDYDYVEPVFVGLHNQSQSTFEIKNGDRICQAELQKTEYLILQQVNEKPLPKSDRDGGFGSTGR